LSHAALSASFSSRDLSLSMFRFVHMSGAVHEFDTQMRLHIYASLKAAKVERRGHASWPSPAERLEPCEQ